MYWPILCQETTFENVTFSPSSGFLTIFYPVLELSGGGLDEPYKGELSYAVMQEAAAAPLLELPWLH